MGRICNMHHWLGGLTPLILLAIITVRVWLVMAIEEEQSLHFLSLGIRGCVVSPLPRHLISLFHYTWHMTAGGQSSLVEGIHRNRSLPWRRIWTIPLPVIFERWLSRIPRGPKGRGVTTLVCGCNVMKDVAKFHRVIVVISSAILFWEIDLAVSLRPLRVSVCLCVCLPASVYVSVCFCMPDWCRSVFFCHMSFMSWSSFVCVLWLSPFLMLHVSLFLYA